MRFVFEVERPGKARIEMLEVGVDTNDDGITSLDDWLK